MRLLSEALGLLRVDLLINHSLWILSVQFVFRFTKVCCLCPGDISLVLQNDTEICVVTITQVMMIDATFFLQKLIISVLEDEKH